VAGGNLEHWDISLENRYNRVVLAWQRSEAQERVAFPPPPASPPRSRKHRRAVAPTLRRPAAGPLDTSTSTRARSQAAASSCAAGASSRLWASGTQGAMRERATRAYSGSRSIPRNRAPRAPRRSRARSTEGVEQETAGRDHKSHQPVHGASGASLLMRLREVVSAFLNCDNASREGRCSTTQPNANSGGGL
jgi:hypothetical protein